MQHADSPTPECFALLDDSNASGERRCRLYTGLVSHLTCFAADDLGQMFEAMQRELRAGHHAVGLFDYELGAQLQRVHPDERTAQPLAQILVFDTCTRMSTEQVSRWLEQQDDGRPSGVANVTATVDEHAFSAAIARIREYIEAGDVYQINYTYRLRFDAYGSPLGLYRRLRARQPVPYGALIALPDGGAVLSLSPELFVRHEAGALAARPMKGTAPASGEAQEDRRRAAALASDAKNRAENLMIVDLLRNDLGRVARFGSVRVPQLFQVERFSSVLQMTSTIEADVREDVSLTQVFAALFPCGSITGAPKRRAMQIIDELETAPRVIYTGAIGWFDAPGQDREIGNFCLSVPIRTLLLDAPQEGLRRGELGVGAGIVYDSVASEEYAECQLKARFLTGLKGDFELFETMRATREGCRHLDLHLARLQDSAACFNFSFDPVAARADVLRACHALDEGTVYRMRLALAADGAVTIQHAVLPPLALPVRLLLASEHTSSDDIFLRHKTSVRSRYDAAWRVAEQQGAFDMLFANERGELTEGGRSNLLVRIEGRWFTPPLCAGVLPGVMRAALLADPDWAVTERNLTLEDLKQAQEIAVCNALRGVLPAQLLQD